MNVNKIIIIILTGFLIFGCKNAVKTNLVKKGDRFVTIRDINTHALVTWGAGTGSYECKLPKGTIIIADYDQGEVAKGFVALPENYGEIDKQTIPESRRKQQYSGYYLVFLQKDIGETLQPLK
jgi:hypothetical protein